MEKTGCRARHDASKPGERGDLRRRWPLLVMLFVLTFACSQHDDNEPTAALSAKQALCSAATMSNAPSAALGAQVQLSASASCAGANPQYRFMFAPSNAINQSSLIHDWSTSNTVTWNTAGLASGTYTLLTYVREASSSGVDATAYSSLLLGTVCDASTLTTSPLQTFPPQPPIPAVGSTINLEAHSTCTGSAPEGGAPAAEYQYYYLSPAPVAHYVRVGCPAGQTDCPTVWTTGPVSINTAGFASGFYGFFVRARAIGNASNQESSAYAPGWFLLGDVCTSTSFSASPVSPQLSGTTIHLNALGSCINGTPEFHFLYRNYHTDLSWHDVSAGYSAAPVDWDTRSLPGGTYQIQVQTRRAGNSSAAEIYSDQNFDLSSPAPLSTDTTTVQDFNSLGTSLAASLPLGWKIDQLPTVGALGNYATSGNSTTTNGGALIAPTAANGIYNFGSGVSNTSASNYWANSTDRAPGWLSSPSGTSGS